MNRVDMTNAQPKNKIQLIWGVALLVVGIAVFFRVSQVMPQIAEIPQFSSVLIFIRISFYIIGFVLVGGGVRKIWAYVQGSDADS
jgi:hypothetical protein